MNYLSSRVYVHILHVYSILRARGSVVGWGTMLDAERSRVQVPMRSLDFFNWPNFSSRTMAQEYPWNVLGGKGRPARRADNLATIYESII
jgi:hypothetical protein